MSVTEELSQRTPEEIETRIAHTRKALDRKLEKLGERFDPNVRFAELKRDVSARVEDFKGGVSARAPQLYAWGAMGAIAAGAVMAMSSWQRLRAHRNGEDLYACGGMADDTAVTEETKTGDSVDAVFGG